MLNLSFSVSLFFILFDFLNKILNFLLFKVNIGRLFKFIFLVLHRLGLELTNTYKKFQRFE